MSLLDRFRVDGKVAIVTGAGRGIGAASALALAEAGADVAITSRSVDELEEIATAIRGFGRRAFVLPGDVNKLEFLDEFANAAIEELGKIDIVVNNAGGSPPAAITDVTAKSFEAAFHFNVTTALALTQACIPQLVENHGCVVNISSMAGVQGGGSCMAYGASKAALNAMTLSLARVLAPQVRVNAILPGFISGEWLTNGMGKEAYEAFKQGWIKASPLESVDDPVDIAETVWWLATGPGKLTGELIHLDNGHRLG